MTTQQSKPRGFAAMTPEVRRAIASKDGKAAHKLGFAHTFSREEAREAGRKGGKVSRKWGAWKS